MQEWSAYRSAYDMHAPHALHVSTCTCRHSANGWLAAMNVTYRCWLAARCSEGRKGRPPWRNGEGDGKVGGVGGDRLAGWLAGWSAGWLAGWLAAVNVTYHGWLVSWLAGWLAGGRRSDEWLVAVVE